MKNIFMVLMLAAGTVLSARAQGLLIFGNNITARTSTNSVANGPATGLVATNQGGFNYALFYSRTATSVNGQTAAILGNTNNNYAFNDSNWTLAAYGTNALIPGRLASANADTSGQTAVAGVAGGVTAQFVVIGWSANLGTNIVLVKSWLNNGFPSAAGFIGQSVVSGAITLGDGGAIPSPNVFGTLTPQIQGLLNRY